MLIAGVALILLSFLIPESGDGNVSRAQIEKRVNDAIKEQSDNMRNSINGIVDESIELAIERTERKLERLSNEKIMAVNEYSETVLKQINDNHNEVMFLYDMLNDKQKALKETVKEADEKEKLISLKAEELEKGINSDKKDEPVNEKKVKVEAETDKSGKKAMFTKLSDKDIEKENKYKNRVVFATETEQVTNPEPVVDFSGKKSLTSGLSDKLAKKKEPARDKVLALANDGKSDVEIAKELGIGVGEVNLILNLHTGRQE